MVNGFSGGIENKGHNGSLILVVEDDLRTLRLERFVLEEEGFAVKEAKNGEEALQALNEDTRALALLDIGLSGIDGFTTCEGIRKASQVIIIIVTAEDKDEDKVLGLEMEADDYVSKPFSTTNLAARVKAVLRRYDLGNIETKPAMRSGPSTEIGAADQTGASTKNGAIEQTLASTENGSIEQTGASTKNGAFEQTLASTENGAIEQTRASTENGSSNGAKHIPNRIPKVNGDSEGAQPAGQGMTIGDRLSNEPAHDNDPIYGVDVRNTSNPNDLRGQAPSGSLEYEGTVWLLVESSVSIKKMVRFVDELRQHPSFRLLRLNANPSREGMEILLRMREPVRLKGILLEMENVSAVDEQSNVPKEIPGEILSRKPGNSKLEGPAVWVTLHE